MSTFTIGKSSPNQSGTFTDVKSPSPTGKSRQQAIQDDNGKRRTLLQDNSWIKKRPEESTNENYGRVVLNQYKSQESLHSNLNEKEDQKVLLGRYRSDTTLDRISDSSNADKSNNSPLSDNRTTNRQSWTPPNTSTTTTAPVKHKRQSWMPPPVSSYKNITVSVENKGQPSTPPNTTTITTVDTKRTIFSSEQTTPERSKTALDDQTRTRPVSPTKPGMTVAEGRIAAERTIRSQDLDNLKENPTSNTNDKGGKDLDDFTVVNTAADKNKRTTEQSHDSTKAPNKPANTNSSYDNRRARDQGLDDLTEVKTPAEQNKNRTTEQSHDSTKAPNKPANTNSSYDNRRASNNTSTCSSSSKDTVVYTRTYKENRKPLNDTHEENVTGKSIKTVYSTSDRSIIEKDMCTFCRKPLGIEAKMILDALQICCHSTCFKCEVCKRSLEDLKAGDSIWIYKNTVHCEPCYSKIKVMICGKISHANLRADCQEAGQKPQTISMFSNEIIPIQQKNGSTSFGSQKPG